MSNFDNPALRALRANVSGKVESGEATPITERLGVDTGRWHGPEGPNGAIRRELPYSEVCMHMRVAGRRMWVAGADGPLFGGVDIVARMIQLYDASGRKFSAPITRGEAGFTH